MKQYHVYVSGKVQGVGFRAFIKRRATEKGIKGYVRNTSDGKVEVVIQNTKKKLNNFLEIIKKGPLGSEVEGIEVIEKDSEKKLDNFKIIQ